MPEDKKTVKGEIKSDLIRKDLEKEIKKEYEVFDVSI
jgi:hypothetical protein